MTIRASSPVRYVAPGKSVKLNAVFEGDSLTAQDKETTGEIVYQNGAAARVEPSSGIFHAGSREGEVTVRASSKHLPSVFSDFTVTVAKPVTKLVSPVKNIKLKKGNSFIIPVSAAGADGPVNLTWKSSNQRVATVNASGRVSAVRKGQARITASSSNGKSVTVTVKIVNKAKKLKGFSVSGYSKTMKRGKSAQLRISISPSDATVKSVSFKSSKPSVLHVDKAGMLTAKKKGTAYITVKVDGKSRKIKISVK
jgi:alpha-amylase